MSAEQEAGWHPGHNPWAIALTVTIATFMEVLDTSIANVALPHIAGSLSVSQEQSTWVLTSYLVSNAIVLPISGWLSSKFGRKRFYLSCVGLFTVSSLLCGLAPNLPALIFFRVLQGVGGGGLGPSEQSILADTFPPAKRGMAFAIYGMAVVLAPAVGPTLGGFITDNYSWRWVFFINVPVGIFSLLLASHMVSDPPWLEEAKKKVRGIDFPGIALIALGLGCLEVVLDKGQEDDWFNSSFITCFAILSASALVAFVVWELRAKNPVVELRLFKNRTFALATLMMLVLGVTLFGSTVLLPQYAQTVLGWSPTQAGEMLSPGGVLIMFMMPFVGRLLQKVDARYLLAFGFIVLSSSMFYMAHHFYTGMDFRTAVELRMFQAAGLAFLFVPISTIAYVGVPQSDNGTVAGMINLARNMGGDIGIAMVTTLLARRSQFHQTRLVSHTSAGDGAFTREIQGLAQQLLQAGVSTADATRRATAMVYRQLQMQVQTLAYIDIIWVFAIGCAICIPVVFLMKANKPGAAPEGAH